MEAKNLFNMVKIIRVFPHKEVSIIAKKVIENNAYFSHLENVLFAMLGDCDQRVRKIEMERIAKLRNQRPARDDHGAIRKFILPVVKFNVGGYHKLAHKHEVNVKEPPLTKNLTEEEIRRLLSEPLKFNHPCHSQAVGRHIRVVSEAARVVTTF